MKILFTLIVLYKGNLYKDFSVKYNERQFVRFYSIPGDKSGMHDTIHDADEGQGVITSGSHSRLEKSEFIAIPGRFPLGKTLSEYKFLKFSEIDEPIFPFGDSFSGIPSLELIKSRNSYSVKPKDNPVIIELDTDEIFGNILLLSSKSKVNVLEKYVRNKIRDFPNYKLLKIYSFNTKPVLSLATYKIGPLLSNLP